MVFTAIVVCLLRFIAGVQNDFSLLTQTGWRSHVNRMSSDVKTTTARRIIPLTIFEPRIDGETNGRASSKNWTTEVKGGFNIWHGNLGKIF
jgi:hypothetical protein